MDGLASHWPLLPSRLNADAIGEAVVWEHVDWSAWTPFYTVADIQDGREWWRNGPVGQVGVYRIVALSAHWPCQVPASINRCCDIDLTGTLYIGQGLLNSRLPRHILDHRSGHPLRLWRWSPALLNKIPIERRAVSWQVLTDIETARVRENELLHLYWLKFGELPPVNLTRSRP